MNGKSVEWLEIAWFATYESGGSDNRHFEGYIFGRSLAGLQDMQDKATVQTMTNNVYIYISRNWTLSSVTWTSCKPSALNHVEPCWTMLNRISEGSRFGLRSRPPVRWDDPRSNSSGELLGTALHLSWQWMRAVRITKRNEAEEGRGPPNNLHKAKPCFYGNSTI